MLQVFYSIVLTLVFVFLGRYISSLFAQKRLAAEINRENSRSRKNDNDKMISLVEEPQISVVAPKNHREVAEAKIVQKHQESLRVFKPLDRPRDGKQDNLSRIKGIGVKIEEKLNAIGCYHFDQIATLSAEDIEDLNKKLALNGRITRDDWIGQARVLSHGEETEFSKRVDSGKVLSSKKG